MQARKTSAAARWFFLVAGFAGLGVLVWREVLTQPAPVAVAPPAVAQVTAASAPPALPPPPIAAEPAAPAPAAPAAATPAPPPPVTAKVEATAAVVPTAAELMAAEADLLLVGVDAQRDAAKGRDRELVKRAIEGKTWNAYRALLGRSVKAGLAKLAMGRGVNRFDRVWNEAPLYQALLRWKTLGCFSEAEITALVFDAYSSGMFTWLLNDTPAMEELLLTVHPKDDAAAVLKFLMYAWSMNEQKYEKYFPLALACAVVFDKPLTIPHPIGKTKNGVESAVDPMQRYLWYVTQNEKGKLAAPVHHSPARDLVWTVCAPVSTTELEWSIHKMHLRRKNWGDAYGMIQYLMERAVEGLNPYKEYSFAEILKEGGICGDQAYFCVNTARAQGIPAMVISGETNLGAHAWAGIKTDADEWTTSTGRVAGATKGQAANPQIGGSITEQEIQLWNDRYHKSPAVRLAVWRHLWLADFFTAMNQTEDNAATVQLANTMGRSFVETWQALFAVLKRQTQLTGAPPIPNNLDAWKTFAKSMRQEFKDNPRMAELAASAELEYIFPYGVQGDAKRTLARERRRIERDAEEQKDLIASSLKREAELISKQGGPDVKRDISRLYDRALRDYGGSITGFKMMAEDYFGYFKDDKELAHKAARDIELAFKRVVETGSTDWFRANAESSIYKMICGYYRSAGDSERAELLEKRYEVLLRRAKRGAL
jgi:hypothetical protein